MPRARDIGIEIGTLPTGPTNSVLDVRGVGLGHATVHRDEPPPPDGRSIARTGVTCLVLADDAYPRPVSAGGAVLNGAGECTGFLSAGEWGLVETPVYLTSTMQLGRVYDGALASRGNAQAPAEGTVGSGTGMSCLGFKGGIGTSSRVTPAGHSVAVLLMTNFGQRDRLTVAGVPVGRLVGSADCVRLARRVGLGLARTGSTAHQGSGEIFLAASTTARADRDGHPEAGDRVAGRALDPLFEAVVDATEEAVLNSLLGAPTTTGRDGHTSEGLDAEVLTRLLEEHRGRH